MTDLFNRLYIKAANCSTVEQLDRLVIDLEELSSTYILQDSDMELTQKSLEKQVKYLLIQSKIQGVLIEKLREFI